MTPISSSPLLIGDNPLMRKIYGMVQRVAATDATVFITGESGTGKEMIARTLHSLSRRSGRPFVPVNCAAIPDELLESELFGHVRGAFTGALAARTGMFQLADGGTIFLDEVAEMPFPLQAKLLRVLQSGELRPLGEDRPRKINARVIASTNKDPMTEVKKGAFREDLFYRLQVIPLHLPPLRARRSDIPLLVNHFLEKNNRKYNVSVQVATEAIVHLWEYDWPGNVRQLENLVEQMVILNEKGIIETENLPPQIVAFTSEKKLSPSPVHDDPPMNLDSLNIEALKDNRLNRNGQNGNGLTLRQAMQRLENQMIDEALRLKNGNKTAAAHMLGVKRTTLVAKLRQRNTSE